MGLPAIDRLVIGLLLFAPILMMVWWNNEKGVIDGEQ